MTDICPHKEKIGRLSLPGITGFWTRHATSSLDIRYGMTRIHWHVTVEAILVQNSMSIITYELQVKVFHILPWSTRYYMAHQSDTRRAHSQPMLVIMIIRSNATMYSYWYDVLSMRLLVIIGGNACVTGVGISKAWYGDTVR